MADADGYILAALQQSDCVDASVDPANWAIRDLTFETLVVIVCKGLARLETADEGTDFGLPESFAPPRGVAARHRLGSKLAGLFKELGYAGDCGYNHFLYPSEKEARSMLAWLVGKLPRARGGDDVSTDGEGSSVAEEDKGRELADSSLSSVLTSSRGLSGADVLRDSDGAGIAAIFAKWKCEKTLFVLPNRDLKGIRGYQSLPLRTFSVGLPWTKTGVHDDYEDRDSTDTPLLNELPVGTLRAASLLESVSVVHAHGRAKRIGSNFYEDAEDTEDAALGTIDLDTVLLKSQSDGRTIETSAAVRGGKEGTVGVLGSLSSLDGQSFGETQDGMRGGVSEQPSAELHAEIAQKDNVAATCESADTRDDDSIEQSQAQLERTQRRIAAMRKAIAKDRSRLQQMEEHITDVRISGQALEKRLAAEKKLLAMLPDAEENVTKLEALCLKQQHKLDSLTQEWEKTRAPLLEEQAQLRGVHSDRHARGRQLVKEMKQLRHEMQGMVTMLQDKARSFQSLEKTYASTPHKDLSRNSYTTRIMDIIKQVHKQKQEIAKIIDDITSVQKQLNMSAEKLKRSEAVAEDKLFSAASKSLTNSSSGTGLMFTSTRDTTSASTYIDCYRKFAQVRELFEELLSVIADVGKKENGVRDLHNWISQLEARDSSRHLDKVLSDLQAVKLENSTLQDQIRAAQGPAA